MQSLKVFLAVAAEASFAAAADRLDLSRAVVSKHVKCLEEQVGTRLLEHPQGDPDRYRTTLL